MSIKAQKPPAVHEIEELCADAERFCALWRTEVAKRSRRTEDCLPKIKAIYEKARDEILPALETTYERLMAFCVERGPDAFDVERMTSPALRQAEEHLRGQLYGERGIGAKVRKVESHRDHLRYVRACVERFTAKLNGNLSRGEIPIIERKSVMFNVFMG